jgi:tRNA G26 N,N-dimethylase Trm1
MYKSIEEVKEAFVNEEGYIDMREPLDTTCEHCEDTGEVWVGDGEDKEVTKCICKRGIAPE